MQSSHQLAVAIAIRSTLEELSSTLLIQRILTIHFHKVSFAIRHGGTTSLPTLMTTLLMANISSLLYVFVR